MGDVKLFRVNDETAEELVGRPVKLEKKLQTQIERHIKTFLHVRFVASEYSTGKTHAGRIDTLGLDENSCPVIIEYKRNSNANVINQGLFYLDWLMDHQAAFELLVQKTLGIEAASELDWSAPRLLCIAEDFSRYDQHAVQQINRNIELIRYKVFGSDLLLLDLVNVVSASGQDDSSAPSASPKASAEGPKATSKQHVERASPETRELYEAVREFITELGDDVQERFLKHHIAYKRIGNFACLVIQKQKVLLYLKLTPESVEFNEGFTRDVRNIGHQGTGDVEVSISSLDDLEKAKPLIQRSFEEN